MRWSSSRRVVHVAASALALGCVTVTTRAFLPSPQNPIYTPSQAEPVLAEYVRLQCDALRKAPRPDSGTAQFVLDVDTRGFTTRAELARGTGDEMLDGVFGAVAAQLSLDAAPAARKDRLAIQYRCAGSDAHVAVRIGGA